VLDLLLQAAAEKEARGKRQLILPVPSRPALARGLLEPRTDQAADIAAVLQVPPVPKVHASHSIEALLQLRSTAALERGRRDYLDGMAAVIDELQQLHNPQADVMLDPCVHVLAAGRIAEDVAAARRSMCCSSTSGTSWSQ